MTVQTKTRVILNLVSDTEIIQQYEKDINWKKIFEDNRIIEFEYSTQAYNTPSIYLPTVDY